MAYVNNTRTASPALSSEVGGIFKSIKVALERRAVFSRTVRELNGLTDRELADLGISRVSIRDVAAQAAYGY
ncbi:DUF1127 domain-containing protein [Neotabrizicola shimadae]|uniref:DUF1127 domain-containing protein n=1 Tax=Neotabrizicola shimadae TaxID=2807096 RepID=A0A8G0ZWU2_9RHOB|nr:DUF1127 domain-containing protein [Neotabrizicola shimadae]QYZ70387.1 DUF1127 domain-containing protein [Neotabrizicola shimadae]